MHNTEEESELTSKKNLKNVQLRFTKISYPIKKKRTSLKGTNAENQVSHAKYFWRTFNFWQEKI